MRPDETDNSYSDENKNTNDDNYRDDGNDGDDGNERNTGIQDLVFKPSRVVMIKELSDEQREQYYNLILANDVKLQYSDNQFVANIRLLGPTGNNNEKKKEKKPLKRVSLNSAPSATSLAHPPGTIRKSSGALTLEKRVRRLQANTNMIPLTFEIEAVAPFDYSVYFRFCALIGDDNDVVRPQLRTVSWMMRIIEDMYDARFIHEKNHVLRRETKLQKVQSSGSIDVSLADEQFWSSFPVFVVQRLTTVVGLKNLTDQTGWDLLCNIDRNYKEYLEIETFKNFLQEQHSEEDLLFFLYVRSIIAKILKVNFSARWILVHGPERQPKTLFLTFLECIQISFKVFGASNCDLGREFLSSIIASKKLVGKLCKREDTRKVEDTRKIDVRDVLHLATLGYRKSQGTYGENRVSPGDVKPMNNPAGCGPPPATAGTAAPPGVGYWTGGTGPGGRRLLRNSMSDADEIAARERRRSDLNGLRLAARSQSTFHDTPIKKKDPDFNYNDVYDEIGDSRPYISPVFRARRNPISVMPDSAEKAEREDKDKGVKERRVSNVGNIWKDRRGVNDKNKNEKNSGLNSGDEERERSERDDRGERGMAEEKGGSREEGRKSIWKKLKSIRGLVDKIELDIGGQSSKTGSVSEVTVASHSVATKQSNIDMKEMREGISDAERQEIRQEKREKQVKQEKQDKQEKQEKADKIEQLDMADKAEKANARSIINKINASLASASKGKNKMLPTSVQKSIESAEEKERKMFNPHTPPVPPALQAVAPSTPQTPQSPPARTHTPHTRSPHARTHNGHTLLFHTPHTPQARNPNAHTTHTPTPDNYNPLTHNQHVPITIVCTPPRSVQRDAPYHDSQFHDDKSETESFITRSESATSDSGSRRESNPYKPLRDHKDPPKKPSPNTVGYSCYNIASPPRIIELSKNCNITGNTSSEKGRRSEGERSEGWEGGDGDSITTGSNSGNNGPNTGLYGSSLVTPEKDKDAQRVAVSPRSSVPVLKSRESIVTVAKRERRKSLDMLINTPDKSNKKNKGGSKKKSQGLAPRRLSADSIADHYPQNVKNEIRITEFESNSTNNTNNTNITSVQNSTGGEGYSSTFSATSANKAAAAAKAAVHKKKFGSLPPGSEYSFAEIYDIAVGIADERGVESVLGPEGLPLEFEELPLKVPSPLKRLIPPPLTPQQSQLSEFSPHACIVPGVIVNGGVVNDGDVRGDVGIGGAVGNDGHIGITGDQVHGVNGVKEGDGSQELAPPTPPAPINVPTSAPISVPVYAPQPLSALAPAFTPQAIPVVNLETPQPAPQTEQAPQTPQTQHECHTVPMFMDAPTSPLHSIFTSNAQPTLTTMPTHTLAPTLMSPLHPIFSGVTEPVSTYSERRTGPHTHLEVPAIPHTATPEHTHAPTQEPEQVPADTQALTDTEAPTGTQSLVQATALIQAPTDTLALAHIPASTQALAQVPAEAAVAPPAAVAVVASPLKNLSIRLLNKNTEQNSPRNAKNNTNDESNTESIVTNEQISPRNNQMSPRNGQKSPRNEETLISSPSLSNISPSFANPPSPATPATQLHAPPEGLPVNLTRGTEKETKIENIEPKITVNKLKSTSRIVRTDSTPSSSFGSNINSNTNNGVNNNGPNNGNKTAQNNVQNKVQNVQNKIQIVQNKVQKNVSKNVTATSNITSNVTKNSKDSNNTVKNKDNNKNNSAIVDGAIVASDTVASDVVGSAVVDSATVDSTIVDSAIVASDSAIVDNVVDSDVASSDIVAKLSSSQPGKGLVMREIKAIAERATPKTTPRDPKTTPRNPKTTPRDPIVATNGNKLELKITPKTTPKDSVMIPKDPTTPTEPMVPVMTPTDINMVPPPPPPLQDDLLFSTCQDGDLPPPPSTLNTHSFSPEVQSDPEVTSTTISSSSSSSFPSSSPTLSTGNLPLSPHLPSSSEISPLQGNLLSSSSFFSFPSKSPSKMTPLQAKLPPSSLSSSSALSPTSSSSSAFSPTSASSSSFPSSSLTSSFTFPPTTINPDHQIIPLLSLLSDIRGRLENDLLASVCDPLKGTGLSDNLLEVIGDEVTLLLHLKINDLFLEEEMTDLKKADVDNRIISFLNTDKSSLSALLIEKREAMVTFVKQSMPSKQ